jgi:hypothetical protein
MVSAEHREKSGRADLGRRARVLMRERKGRHWCRRRIPLESVSGGETEGA